MAFVLDDSMLIPPSLPGGLPGRLRPSTTVASAGRCQFIPETEAGRSPQFEMISSALRASSEARLRSFESETAPGVLAFQASSGVSVPADGDTQEAFNGLSRMINEYLSTVGDGLVDPGKALLQQEQLIAPYRVPVDGKLSSKQLAALRAIAMDASQRLGVKIATPASVQSMSDRAREITRALRVLLVDVRNRVSAAGSTTQLAPRRKRSKIAIGIGVGVVGLGIFAALRR